MAGTKATAWFAENAMRVKLELTDPDNGNAPVSGATVVCSVVDKATGNPLSAATTNVSLPPIAVGSHVYKATIPHTHGGGEDGEGYLALITATKDGVQDFWKIPLTGMPRER